MKSVNERAKGSIEITDVRRSNRSEVVRVKDTPAEKSYTIRFLVEPLSKPELEVLTAPLDLTKEDDNDDENNSSNTARYRAY